MICSGSYVSAPQEASSSELASGTLNTPVVPLDPPPNPDVPARLPLGSNCPPPALVVPSMSSVGADAFDGEHAIQIPAHSDGTAIKQASLDMGAQSSVQIEVVAAQLLCALLL